MIVPVYYDKFNVQSILKRSAADLSAAEEAAKIDRMLQMLKLMKR